jgi:hypothetical protein
MDNLLNEILHIFSENRGMAEKLSKGAGYSQGSALTKALRKPSGEFEKFNGLIYVVNSIYGEETKEKFLSYAKQLSPNKFTSKTLLEYATQNRYSEITNYLIDEFKKSTKREAREWGIVYDLDRKSAKRELTGYDLINEASPVQFKQPEVKVFAKLVQIYEYYDMKKYHYMETVSETLEEEIRGIPNEFIRDSYLIRFCLIMASVKLHKGKLEESRHYAKTGFIHTMTDNFSSLFQLFLGNSFVFENYHLAKSHFNKALELASKDSYQSQEIKRSMNFLDNVWGKEPKFLSHGSKEVSDMHEIIFAYINKGNFQYANCVMKETESLPMTNSNKAFNNYLRWLLTDEEDYLIESIKFFKDCDDYYYIKLPTIKLELLGYKKKFIEMLIA